MEWHAILTDVITVGLGLVAGSILVAFRKWIRSKTLLNVVSAKVMLAKEGFTHEIVKSVKIPKS